MIFFGILLLLVSVYRLIKGNFAHNLMLKIIEYDDDKDKITLGEQQKMLVQLLFFIGFSITYFFTYLIFLINSLKVDVYTYPTVIMIVWFVFGFGYGLIKGKRDAGNKENAKNKYKKSKNLMGTLGDLITTVYLVYIIGLIIF